MTACRQAVAARESPLLGHFPAVRLLLPRRGRGTSRRLVVGSLRMLHGPKKTQCFARQLRRRMTLPEILLWRALRTRPAGLRFRRQHPAGIYEVDGERHARGDQPARDAARDDWLDKQGVRVLRIPAQTILSDLEAAIRHIVVTARGDYPSTGFAGPPPPPGEECARRESRQTRRLLSVPVWVTVPRRNDQHRVVSDRCRIARKMVCLLLPRRGRGTSRRLVEG